MSFRIGIAVLTSRRGVDQNLGRLSYTEVSRPIHPLDDPMPAPDLRARILR